MVTVAILILVIGLLGVGILYIYTRIKHPERAGRFISFGGGSSNIKQDIGGPVNAIVLGVKRHREAHLSEDELNRLSDRWYIMLNGLPGVICQENPETGQLEPWHEQHHAISELAPHCVTPEALADMTEWKQVIGDYFESSSVGTAAFNKGMMVALMIGISLFAFLIYSAQGG